MTTNEGSWFDLEPSSHDEKGVPKCSPDFALNPTILSAQTIQGALPTLFHTPTTQTYFYHTLLGGASHPLNICLNADAILHHSEQVAERSLKSKDLSSSPAQYPKDRSHNIH